MNIKLSSRHKAQPPGPAIPVALQRYRFEFIAREPVALPAFAGSAWRGVFGHSLRRLACVTGQKTCHGCLLQSQCVYPRIFEPEQRPAAHTSKDQPRPYVLYPGPLGVKTAPENGVKPVCPGQSLSLELTLINDAINALPYVVEAFKRAGDRGLGRKLAVNGHRRGRLDLNTIEALPAGLSDAAGEVIYRREDPRLTESPRQDFFLADKPPESDTITLQWLTPLRLKRRTGMLDASNLHFYDLFVALLRRIESFVPEKQRQWDSRQLLELARNVTIENNQLAWRVQTRYSSRQQKSVNISGLTGQVTFASQDWQALWPFLSLGQWLHVGKGAVMGLGRYRLIKVKNAEIRSEFSPDKKIVKRPLQVLDFSGKITPDC